MARVCGWGTLFVWGNAASFNWSDGFLLGLVVWVGVCADIGAGRRLLL